MQPFPLDYKQQRLYTSVANTCAFFAPLPVSLFMKVSVQSLKCSQVGSEFYLVGDPIML
jgi:hypothetical protein